jgi:hypothetical protein
MEILKIGYHGNGPEYSQWGIPEGHGNNGSLNTESICMEFMHNAYGKFLPFTHDFK